MASYTKLVGRNFRKVVPVSVAVKATSEQIPNSDGCMVFQVSKWTMLDRFLILGSDSPTYYASAEEASFKNYQNVLDCIKEDGIKAVNRITEISTAFRAPKQNPALFALALCMSCDNVETKRYAATKVNDICKIGTNLMMLIGFLDDLRGRGHLVIKSIANWFNNRDPGNLVQQVIKYRNREGFEMRDCLRIGRPKPADDFHKDVYHWVCKGWESVGPKPHPDKNLARIWAFEKIKISKDANEIAALVRDYKLPWEALDTEWLKNQTVWEAIIESIKPEAMMRSLGKLTAAGIIKPMSKFTTKVCEILTNQESIMKNGVHPLKILVALKTYESGHGVKGNLTWTPVQDIIDALNEAFELSFGTIKPTGKRIMYCLDISASMDGRIAGMPISARDASGALALVSHRVEKQSYCIGFSHSVIPLPIGRKDSFSSAIKKITNLPFGDTNIGAAIEYAINNKLEVDAFVIITDNEVNSGSQPFQLLKKYRKLTGINTKMVVMATTPVNFSIADPNDGQMLDCVGFDLSVPQIMNDFIRGDLS